MWPAGGLAATTDILYLCYHFPSLSATFVYQELLALRRQGFSVRILAVRRPPDEEVSREATELAEECDYVGDLRPRDFAGDMLWWLTRRPGALLSTLKIVGAPTPSLADRARLAYHVALALHIGRMRRLDDVGIIHVHFAGAAADIALGLHRLLGVPLSIVAHAAELYRGANALGLKLAAATPFITISHYNRRYLGERFGVIAARVQVVHCGVPVASYSPAPAPATGTPLVVAIGRLTEKKGHDTLIRACGLLRDRGCELRCSIVGGGELDARLRSLVQQLQLEATVELLGPRDHAETLSLLGEARISALACRVADDGDRDGIPVSLMESLAMGVPTVSTAVSGIEELIVDGETGLIIAPNDPCALADAVQRLLADEGLARRLALAGRAKVEREFDADANASAVGRLLVAAAPAIAARDAHTAGARPTP